MVPSSPSPERFASGPERRASHFVPAVLTARTTGRRANVVRGKANATRVEAGREAVESVRAAIAAAAVEAGRVVALPAVLVAASVSAAVARAAALVNAVVALGREAVREAVAEAARETVNVVAAASPQRALKTRLSATSNQGR